MLYTITVNPVQIELQKTLTAMRIEEWLAQDVFQLKWWFLVLVFVVSIYSWWKLVDKARLQEISLYMAITIIFTLGLDECGEELALWYYTVDIVPIFPPLTAVDLAALPIIYSLIYQYYGTWRSFFGATVIMAVIFAFVLEPILVWGEFYVLHQWKYYYGFPIYIIMALVIKWIVEKIKSMAASAVSGIKKE